MLKMFVNTIKRRGNRYCQQSDPHLVNSNPNTKARAVRYSNDQKIVSGIRFSDRLFSQAQDVGMQVIGHPFHAEMVKGTLCSQRFRRFIVQDIFYLEGCIKSFEIAQRRFSNQSDLFALLISDTEVELDVLKRFLCKLQIDKNCAETSNRACEKYISFLIEVAEKGGLVEIIGALWPCYSVFLEMYHAYTKDIDSLTSNHPYYELVKYYKELLVLPSVELMKEVTNSILIETQKEEKICLKQAFFRCFYLSLEHERQFFDAIYEVDKKVVNAPRTINSIISIRERLLAMPRGSWVFWDLDDTIWVSDLPLLRAVNNQLLEDYICTIESQYTNIRDLIWELYYCCDYRLVEDEVLTLFSDLKEKGIHLFALTKRETGYSMQNGVEGKLFRHDLTLMKLKKLGVSFSSIFSEGEIVLKKEENRNSSVLKAGAVFTSFFDKGPILRELLIKSREHGVLFPPEIAFFDNIDDNIHDVEAVFKVDDLHGIPLLAVHYKAAYYLPDNEFIDYQELDCRLRNLQEKLS